jgi:small neutral amino acid transporter SnatA (MarC family)
MIFFLVANPIGNAPAILALVKDFDLADQRRILIREVGIAFLLALFFQFFGDLFFGQILKVKSYTNQLTGGILLFLTSLFMIFPSPSSSLANGGNKEPFIVPIATPLLSGPGLLTIIMLKASEENNNLKIFFAILLAWVGVATVLMIAPFLQKVLKQRGMVALEQLMGMALSLMSIEMVVKGVWLYNQTLH